MQRIAHTSTTGILTISYKPWAYMHPFFLDLGAPCARRAPLATRHSPLATGSGLWPAAGLVDPTSLLLPAITSNAGCFVCLVPVFAY
jgi:hypothetical protein